MAAPALWRVAARPAGRALCGPLVGRAATAALPATGFTPVSLFSSGQAGIIIDVQSADWRAALRQEVANPATAVGVGDAIGTWADASPNNHALAMAADAYRPVLGYDAALDKYYIDAEVAATFVPLPPAAWEAGSRWTLAMAMQTTDAVGVALFVPGNSANYVGGWNSAHDTFSAVGHSDVTLNDYRVNGVPLAHGYSQMTTAGDLATGSPVTALWDFSSATTKTTDGANWRALSYSSGSYLTSARLYRLVLVAGEVSDADKAALHTWLLGG